MPYEKSKRKNVNKNPLFEILKAVLTGNILFILLIALSSLLLLNIEIPSDYLFIFVIISSAISAFFTSVIAIRSTKKNKLFIGMVSAVLLTVIQFFILLCFNNANLAIRTYILFPISLFISFIGCVAGINIWKK